MSAEERAQLRRLIELYVGRMNAASAKEALARLDRAGFEKVRFAWAGGIESGQPHYYRIHGPTLLIEYDDTQNEANHIHTVYRDLERDFGGDALRAHYRRDRIGQSHSIGNIRIAARASQGLDSPHRVRSRTWARRTSPPASDQWPHRMIDIGIKGRDREKIVQGLSRVLADTYTLYLKTHNFHWNVEGPMFNTLHLMFMDQYTELWNALDAIAERIRSLGYPVPGTGKEFARLTSIEETEGVPDALDMVRLLVAGHEAVTRTARAAFPAAEKAGDESSCDLLTQRLQIHEKTAWMLRSLLK